MANNSVFNFRKIKKQVKFTFADIVNSIEQSKIRMLSATGTLVTITLYLIAQMVGAGSLIQILFGLPYEVAVCIVGILMMFMLALVE